MDKLQDSRVIMNGKGYMNRDKLLRMSSVQKRIHDLDIGEGTFTTMASGGVYL